MANTKEVSIPPKDPASKTNPKCLNCCDGCLCTTCDNEYRDSLLKLLEDQLKTYGTVTKKIIGVLLSLLAFIIVMIIAYFSFPVMKIWKNFYWLDFILSYVKMMPAEFYISLGFITAALTNILHKYVELFLLFSLSVVTIMWAYINGQWLALGAGLVILFYGILRSGLFNNYIGVYFLGLFRYITWILIGLLAGNFFISFAKFASIIK